MPEESVKEAGVEDGTIKPLFDRLMVEIAVDGYFNTQTDSGIWLTRTDGIGDSVGFGMVHGMGPDVRVKVALGDRVCFARYAGQDYEREDGQVFTFVKEKDLHGVIEG